ncbi:MAG TPA: class F sortase [Streptosporangiaceae bacterium]
MSLNRRSVSPSLLRFGLAAALVSAGAVVFFTEVPRFGRPGPPPQPASSELVENPPAGSAQRVGALPASVPERIRIPAIKVNAPIITVGLEPDGQLEVPPLTRVDEAGWYKDGPTPGEAGPSVIVGHVDSKSGPGVFYRLGALKPGQNVQIIRKDGTTPLFRVSRIQRVPKDAFPTRSVYGPADGPALRLITCGGKFDAASGHYLDNIIVYASPATGSWPVVKEHEAIGVNRPKPAATP